MISTGMVMIVQSLVLVSKTAEFKSYAAGLYKNSVGDDKDGTGIAYGPSGGFDFPKDKLIRLINDTVFLTFRE